MTARKLRVAVFAPVALVRHVLAPRDCFADPDVIHVFWAGSPGCSALSVKCQVSNHKPVGGAGETNG
jgi:hypothetical protein